MFTPSRDPKSPAELLQMLGGRVKTAAQLFAAEPVLTIPAEIAEPESAPTTVPKNRHAPSLMEMIPNAERVTFGGRSCLRITSETTLDGTRNKFSYCCPAGTPAASSRSMMEALALFARDPRIADVDPEKLAFIDTETTSLASGSGTYLFLIGIGRFCGPTFRVNQYFMEDYSCEDAQLAAAAEDLNGAEAFVSYNGKCFDVPLMQARWAMNRRRPKFPELHLDLLHFARRLWRKRLESCSLGSVEREILKIMRFSDMPGSLIPGIYLDYLNGFGRERMLPVVDHHAQDIYSLGALVHVFARAILNPDDPMFAHSSDQWGLARTYHQAGMIEESVERLERAILAARDEELGFKLSMILAKRLSRMGRGEDATEIWQARLNQVRQDRLEPLIELAKFAEHRMKDYEQAKDWIMRAIEIVDSGRKLNEELGFARIRREEVPVSLKPLLHRLARIERRLSANCEEDE